MNQLIDPTVEKIHNDLFNKLILYLKIIKKDT